MTNLNGHNDSMIDQHAREEGDKEERDEYCGIRAADLQEDIILFVLKRLDLIDRKDVENGLAHGDLLLNIANLVDLQLTKEIELADAERGL